MTRPDGPPTAQDTTKGGEHARFLKQAVDLDVLALAAQAADAIRALNHRTRHLDVFEIPNDLCQVIADLQLTAQGLPQLVTQLSRWLASRNAEGHLAADDGTDPGVVAGHVVGALHAASRHADLLASSLDDAQQHAARLTRDDIERRTPVVPGQALTHRSLPRKAPRR